MIAPPSSIQVAYGKLYCRKAMKLRSRTRNKIIIKLENPTFAFKYHLISIHSIGNQIPEKGSLESDVDDPNFYCRICKQTYADKLYYRHHLCRNHRMKLKSLRNCQYDPDFFPDPLDLNFYCSVCKSTKPLLKRHRQHCRVAHFMGLNSIPFAYLDAVIDLQSPGFYCAKCDKHLMRTSNFLYHLEAIHSLKQPKFPYPNANIDVFDSNFYCAVAINISH